jgi:hypothetical protein
MTLPASTLLDRVWIAESLMRSEPLQICEKLCGLREVRVADADLNFEGGLRADPVTGHDFRLHKNTTFPSAGMIKKSFSKQRVDLGVRSRKEIVVQVDLSLLGCWFTTAPSQATLRSPRPLFFFCWR